MQTVITDDFSSPVTDRSVVTIGNFDGVHCGHQEIFRQVISKGKELSATSVVVTFNPHPLRILQPDQHRFSLLTTEQQKERLIEQCGLDLLLVIPFSSSFASRSPLYFTDTVLHRFLNARHLVIGHDYAFGAGRSGNGQFLVARGEELGFTVQILDQVGSGGLLFSSSAIRRMVADGQVDQAAEALGRFYSIEGVVVPGRAVGRSIGFPTANIATDNELLPGDGVYAVKVQLEGELRKAVCSIGKNPTFNATERSVEVFLLDCNEDLYGRQLELQFVTRIRGMMKFPNPAALSQQIKSDVCTASEILDAAGAFRRFR